MGLEKEKKEEKIYDFVIIGSGFGGSVSAMRLSQKGYKVLILEMGKEYKDQDFPKSNWNIKKFFWFPRLKFFGIQKITFFRHLLALQGVGVGGGSLVYANTLMTPVSTIFDSSKWGPINFDSLSPYYTTAQKMLGVTTVPKMFAGEEALKEVGKILDCEESFHPTQVGIFFHEKEGEVFSDPYFKGKGPSRVSCTYCGACMIGCQIGAKNTLNKNYLYWAKLWGAIVSSGSRVKKILPSKEGGYTLEVESLFSCFSKNYKIYAPKVILAAGAIGTVELLLKNKFFYKSLPFLSDELGQKVLTNGESLLGATELHHSSPDYSQGVAIGAAIHPSKGLKIENVRYPKGSGVMRLLAVPLTKGPSFRFLSLLATLAKSWPRFLRFCLTNDWASRTVIFLGMQQEETRLNLSYSWWRGLVSSPVKKNEVPQAFNATAQKAAEILSWKVMKEGFGQNVFSEVLFKTPATAHVLGGAIMAPSEKEGVIDYRHEVFHYPNLYICDGSVIPTNLGVNPSLTITALAERFCNQFPVKKGEEEKKLEFS